VNINWIKKLRIALASLALLGLAACGGAGGGGGTPIEKGYAPLQTAVVFQSGVQIVEQQNIVSWKVISRQGTNIDSPATLFEVPNTQSIQVGKVYVVNQMAYKVDSVSLATPTTNFVYVSQPSIQEIFSTFKLSGDLPITKMELTSNPVQAGLLQADTAKTGIKWADAGSFMKPIDQQKDYDPASLVELGGGCLKIETDQGDFDDGGVKVKPFGFKIDLSCAKIQDAGGIMSGQLNLTGGIYPKLSFKDGFDLTNPDSYDGNFQHTFYTKLSGGLSATGKIKLSKLLRLVSIKSYIPIPGTPVVLTIWTPLDLVFQAEAGTQGKLTWDVQGKYVVDSRGGQWTTLKPFAPLPELKETVSISLTALLRPGVGLGVYGLTPFSFHPKGGIKGEIEYDILQSCTKTLVKMVWGADIVLLPNTWIQVGSDPWEKKHTKELIALVDGAEFVNKSIGNGCSAPIANISQNDSTLPPPQISRNLNGSDIRLDSRWLFFGGIQLMGNGSIFADTYEWRIENDLGQSAVLGNQGSINLLASDLTKVLFPTKVTLTVSNGGLTARTNKAVVNLVSNKPPIAAGILVKIGTEYVLTSSSADVDGRVTQIEWSDSVTNKVIASQTSNGELRLPLASVQTSSNASLPVTLKLKVWDNDGAIAEQFITEQPAIASISPPVATLNTPQIFTVTGTNLPLTAVLSMADAVCQTPTNRAASGFTVSCTPQGTATGVKVITVKTDTLANGGTVIDASKTVNVSAAAVAAYPKLFPTGVDALGNALAAGSPDPHYAILLPNQPAVVVLNNVGTWIPDSATSMWIWETSSGLPVNVTRTFRTTVDLTGLDPNLVSVLGTWATDNGGIDILINGVSTGNTCGGFQAYCNFAVNSGFVAGVNTLDFVVTDVGVISGFRVDTIGIVPKAAPSNPFTVDAINAAGTVFTVPTGATSCTFAGSGAWNYAVGASVTPTGGGVTLAGYIWPMPSAPAWSLIAKRLNGTYQYVGLSSQMTVIGGESIVFMMNDGQGAYADNSGAVSVTWACQ
jgi:hypothetical protein